MSLRRVAGLIAVAASVGMAAISSFVGVPSAAAVTPAAPASTSNPIEHVVVILEENHSFDNVLGQVLHRSRQRSDRRPGTGHPLQRNGERSHEHRTGHKLVLRCRLRAQSADHSVVGQQRDIANGP